MSFLTSLTSAFKAGATSRVPVSRGYISPWATAFESTSGRAPFDYSSAVAEAYCANPVAQRSEGDGPYQRLVLRGAYMIDGTGAPAQGPVDIVVENDRIAEIRKLPRAVTPVAIPLKDGLTAADLEARGAVLLERGLVDLIRRLDRPVKDLAGLHVFHLDPGKSAPLAGLHVLHLDGGPKRILMLQHIAGANFVAVDFHDRSEKACAAAARIVRRPAIRGLANHRRAARASDERARRPVGAAAVGGNRTGKGLAGRHSAKAGCGVP